MAPGKNAKTTEEKENEWDDAEFARTTVDGPRKREYLSSLHSALKAYDSSGEFSRYTGFIEVLKGANECDFLEELEIFMDSGLPSTRALKAAPELQQSLASQAGMLPSYESLLASAKAKVYEGLVPEAETANVRKRRGCEAAASAPLPFSRTKVAWKDNVGGKRIFEISVQSYEMASRHGTTETEIKNNVYSLYKIGISYDEKSGAVNWAKKKLGRAKPPLRIVEKKISGRSAKIYALSEELDAKIGSLMGQSPDTIFRTMESLEGFGIKGGTQIKPLYVEKVTIGPFKVKENNTLRKLNEEFRKGFILRTEKRAIREGGEETSDVTYICSENFRDDVEKTIEKNKDDDKSKKKGNREYSMRVV